jgi:hypothetical protein
MLGWLGLVTLIQYAQPGSVEQILFLALLLIATGGTATVLVRIVNRRYVKSDWPQRDPWRAEREGALFGTWLALVAWLRLHHTLDWSNLVLMAGVVMLLELAFLLRRSPKNPG